MIEATIDGALAAALVSSQFPQWSDFPIRPVEPGGWDNRTFRLGDDMLIRMPSAAAYAPQVEKEQRWLPALGARLSTTIPAPIAAGRPEHGYPWPWSIYRWIDGVCAAHDAIDDVPAFATDVAAFLRDLHQASPPGGPLAGAHNFHRGGSLRHYDGEFRAALCNLEPDDRAQAASVWDAALSSSWANAPVWLHGDLAPTNLLVRDGRLAAVIDFGCCGVGDPACDLVMAWTFFDARCRRVFSDAMSYDAPTWRRARGWALWKAAISLAIPARRLEAQRQVHVVLADDSW